MNKYNRLGYFIGEDTHLRSQVIYDDLTVGDNFVTNPGGAAEAGEFVNGYRIPKTLISPGGIFVDGYGSSLTSLKIRGTKSGSGGAEPQLTLSRRGFNASDGDRAGTLVFECPLEDSTEGSPIAAFNASWSDVSNKYARLAVGIRSTAKLPPTAGLEGSYGRVIEGIASGATQIDVLLGFGAGSTTTVSGDLTISGSDFTFDSVALTGIQTSSESFSNDDVSLMTSAAIQDEVLSSAPAVTLAGSLDYLTISGQEITRNAIDLAADVTGTLPTGSGGTGSTSTTYCSLTANVSGTLPVANGGTGATSLTDNKLLTGTGTSAVTAEANATYDGADLTLTSATSTKPILSIENTTHDSNAGELRLIGRRSADASVIAGAGDDAGTISFVGENAKTGPDPETITYGKIVSESSVVTDGGEMGQMTMSVGANLSAIGGSLGFLDFMRSTASILGETTTYGSGAIFSTTVFNGTITEFQSTVSTGPIMSIKNLTNDATGGSMTFMNSRGGTSLNAPNVNGDDLGTIKFAGFDSNAASAPGITTTFAQILGEANEITNGDEAGKFTIQVAASNGTTSNLRNALFAEGSPSADDVDVTIGHGSTSTTTIGGDLKVNSGNIYGKTDNDLILRSDDDIALLLDGDNDGTSSVKITNGASTSVVVIAESGSIYTAGEIDLGHPNDTTIARHPSGGKVLIEGNEVVTAGAVNVSSGSQAPIGMQIARRTITQAEANDLHNTPIELVPAQGANTIIIPHETIFRVDRASTQTVSTCNVHVHYADVEPGVVQDDVLIFLRRFMFNETGDRVIQGFSGTFSGTQHSQNLTNDVNHAVEVSFSTAATTNCFTSIDVFTLYHVIDIS